VLPTESRRRKYRTVPNLAVFDLERLFGSLELLASVSGAFYDSPKRVSNSHDLGVVVSLTGAAFLFVKGFNDCR